MVAIKAMQSLTTSCVSELRCFLGTSARKNMPSSAPVKTHPNTMHAIATELSIYPQDVEWWPTRAEYRGGRARRQAATVGRLASTALTGQTGCAGPARSLFPQLLNPDSREQRW